MCIRDRDDDDVSLLALEPVHGADTYRDVVDCLTIKSRCSRYGVITATDAPLRAHRRAALTTVATTFASDSFMMDDLDEAPTPSSP